MRSKKALMSTAMAFLLQVTNIISALIIPKLIISHYGSSVNGLLSSITQFLGYVSLLQLGVGGVTRAALYKPLANKDTMQVSRVIRATEKFYQKIALISGVYIGALAILYPFITHTSFEWEYVSTMVLIIGVSTFVQYFFGFPYRLLILADQRSYIYDATQIIAVVMNVLITIVLIKANCSAHMVKLGSSVVFVMQPIVLNIYVKRKYKIQRKVAPDNDALEQRWAGMGYSLADFIHRKTDMLVLTVLSSLTEVSVYSVYAIVTNGLNSIITMATNSFQAVLGDMNAKAEIQNLKRTFGIYSFIVHTIATTVFSVAIIMIIPFVHLYTSGIADADYVRPTFAFLILFAEFIYCLRQPYQSMVIAAGKFRETQKGAIIEACINIIISLLIVKKMGIVGVAIGTCMAMLYRTADLAWYLVKNILHLSFVDILKRYLVSVMIFLFAFVLSNALKIQTNSYSAWFMYSVVCVALSGCLVIGVNCLLFKNDFMNIKQKVKGLYIFRGRR